jgi:tRNA-(ms[2]io[6]A)-hydroxylase
MSGAIRLRTATDPAWAARAAAHLPELLADHAVCELQAAVFALSLVGAYPGEPELVDGLSALAAEELRHFRKVVKEARKRGAALPTKRRNSYVAALRQACRSGPEPERGLDLLLVAALIETRSHERFLLLAPHLEEPLARTFRELADDEARHGPVYLALAASHAGAEAAAARMEELLDVEAAALAGATRTEIAVHSAA